MFLVPFDLLLDEYFFFHIDIEKCVLRAFNKNEVRKCKSLFQPVKVVLGFFFI